MTPWSQALIGSRGASTQDTVDGGALSAQQQEKQEKLKLEQDERETKIKIQIQSVESTPIFANSQVHSLRVSKYIKESHLETYQASLQAS